MPLATEVGLGLRDNVLDGDPAPPPLKVHSPQFSADAYCGQTAECISIPLGTEVDLGPGDIVLDGDPAPPKGAQPRNFRPMSIVAQRSPMSATAELLLSTTHSHTPRPFGGSPP